MRSIGPWLTGMCRTASAYPGRGGGGHHLNPLGEGGPAAVSVVTDRPRKRSRRRASAPMMPTLALLAAVFFLLLCSPAYADDRIRPVCDDTRTPRCWVPHEASPMKLLVPVEPAPIEPPPGRYTPAPPSTQRAAPTDPYDVPGLPPVPPGGLPRWVLDYRRAMHNAMEPMSDALQLWTIYDHPRDYPDVFVARMFLVDAKGWFATDKVVTAESLEHLRLKLPPGLYRLRRHADDDAKIVEVWL